MRESKSKSQWVTYVFVSQCLCGCVQRHNKEIKIEKTRSDHKYRKKSCKNFINDLRRCDTNSSTHTQLQVIYSYVRTFAYTQNQRSHVRQSACLPSRMKKIDTEESEGEKEYWIDLVVVVCFSVSFGRIKFSPYVCIAYTYLRWSDQIESNLSVILWYLLRYTHKSIYYCLCRCWYCRKILLLQLLFCSMSFGNSSLIVWFVRSWFSFDWKYSFIFFCI